MTVLRAESVTGSGEEALDTGIAGLHVVPAAGERSAVLYATTGMSGGVSSYRLAEGHGPVRIDTQYFTGPSAGTVDGRLQPLVLDGRAHLVVGSAQDQLTAYGMARDGGIADRVQLAAPMGAAARITASREVGGTGLLYLADARHDTLTGYRANGAESLRQLSRIRDDDASHIADVTALADLRVGGRNWLIAGSGSEHGISSYRVNRADGHLVPGGAIGAGDGLGMAVPTAIGTAVMDGTGYVIVATAGASGSGMGALSVMRLTASGGLVPTDHVLDTRATRFGQVQDLETVQVGGRVYVIAGGGDDGVSLLTLLPGGRLLHLDVLADGAGRGLAGITALAAARLGDEVQIAVAAQSEPGLALLSFDAGGQGASIAARPAGGIREGGPRDDVMTGGPGEDRLRGKGGADILTDGAGRDTLTGGAGADIFVFEADGARDRVDDFQPGLDTLDLSDFPFFYGGAGLRYRVDGGGAVISWRDEQIELRRADGGDITEAEVRAAIRAGPDRPALGLARESAGTGGDDRMTGFWGTDMIDGAGGADRLDGAAGDDALIGGPGADTLLGGNGRDRLTGGVGKDVLAGGADADVLLGGPGDDTLQGGDGTDTLNGGEGDDFIFGGASAADLRDVIYGGDGRDRIDGGYGNDALYGMDGADTLAGGFGADTLQGQGGDDVITGSSYSDLVFGGDGADFVNGGFGHDRLSGGAGPDRFYHLGIRNHGSDWIQDYSAAEGDVLRYGAAGGRSDFQVNLARTEGAGRGAVDEAFVIHRPTGLILWALVDGGAEAVVRVQTDDGLFGLSG